MNKSLFSSKKMDWETPNHIINQLECRYGQFQLDAACSSETCKAIHGFTPECDGLAQDWSKYQRVWMNPPYSKHIPIWLNKAYTEALKGCQVVCLIPSRTDTRYFHSLIHNKASEVLFVQGRIKFLDSDKKELTSAPFPSMIVVYNGQVTETKYSTIKFTK